MGTSGTKSLAARQPLLDETDAFANALQVALSNADGLQAVAVDFTRLFGGISEAYGSRPPYESAVRSGTWGGDIAVAVAAVYASAEIEPPVPTGAPHDHLVAELGFLAIACFREAEAWQLGNRNAALDWVMRQRDFLDQHLLTWLPDYCRQLADLAQTPFYRALLDLLPKACRIDREDIESILLVAEPLAAHG